MIKLKRGVNNVAILLPIISASRFISHFLRLKSTRHLNIIIKLYKRQNVLIISGAIWANAKKTSYYMDDLTLIIIGFIA